MLELVPDSTSEKTDSGEHKAEADTRPSATIHYIYDPFNPPLTAIISVARRLQEVLLEYGALPEGAPLPFPALAPNPDN